MRTFGWVASAAALALSASVAFAEPLPTGDPVALGFDPAKLKALDVTMDRAVDGGEVAGVLTMVARHGKVVDVHMYGNKHTAGDPVTRDTIFRMYSQTKPLVGVAMMILYEKGLWKLDDPVTKFIPEFAHLKVLKADGTLEDAVRPPNMRELMTHSAGFGYGLRTGNPVDDAFREKKVLQSNGLKEMVDKIATIPLLFQPGTKWSYSAAVDIQGYIVEKLSGQSLGDFMRDNIFRPLGMKDTGFYVPEADAARLSGVFVSNQMTGNKLYEIPSTLPNMRDFTKPPPMDSGGGGSVSTADDYALFCQTILNKGELYGVRILKPETVALMEQNQLENTVQISAAPGGHNVGGDALGFGLDFAVSLDPAKMSSPQGAGSIWWGGAAGTWFWIDPKNDLFFLGMIQRFGSGVADNEGLGPASIRLTYGALTNPEK
ncbi:MAG: beta-lactamase family protein [Alphaproteobacteria bacterium]|nr:beta-lactamase family protein [Alphaproteobacteria bacterium]MBL7099487.1 beta-lactamase family protein [Alphaproteobacteria bacterium]